MLESGFAHLANQPTVGLYYLRVSSGEEGVTAAGWRKYFTYSWPFKLGLVPSGLHIIFMMYFMQEHICSAAPTVVEDYRDTRSLSKELEVCLRMPGRL